MTPTPSLRRRVVRSSLFAVAALTAAVLAAVFVVVKLQLDASLEEVLETRALAVLELAADASGEELAETLRAAGIPAVVRTADGREYRATPATGGTAPVLPQSDRKPLPPPVHVREVQLPGGDRVDVLASGASVVRTLRSLAVAEGVGLILTLLVAALVLRRTTEAAMEPLTAVVAAADRTAAGDLGQRITPDDPSTELGRLASSFDAMVAALEEALADARESDERSQRFLQDAAHQLRTPIATIRASVELIIRTDDPADRDELLVGIVRDTARSSRLLSALLRVARLERGEEPARMATDLAALCEDEVERARSLSPTLDVRLDVADGLPTVNVHAGDVREALANLLDNARRHAASRVTVTVEPQSDAVLICVQDDGPGIPADRVETVFERFASDAPGGSGLGLPIARGIAEAHGGGLVYTDRGFEMTLALEPRPAGPALS